MFAISIVIINQSNNPVYAQVQSSNFMRITDDFYRNKGNCIRADVTDVQCYRHENMHLYFLTTGKV